MTKYNLTLSITKSHSELQSSLEGERKLDRKLLRRPHRILNFLEYHERTKKGCVFPRQYTELS